MREMKDSGIEWIGEIPKEWKVIKTKYVANLFTGNSISDNDKDKYTDKVDSIPYIATKDIKQGFNTIDYDNGLFVKKYDMSFVRAMPGSTLMCIEGGSAGRKKGFVDRTICFVNKLCCFSPINMDGRFLYYVLNSPSYEAQFNLNVSGLIGGVSKSLLDEFIIPNPELAVQKKIADYLDTKCFQIDNIITKQEKIVERVEKYRFALIDETIRNGLNLDVSKTDTGNPWIGTIPKHWEVKKLGTHATMLTPMRDKPEDLSGDIPWVRIEDYDGKYISQSKEGFGVSLETVKRMNLKIYPVGSILCTSSCDLGKCAIVAKELVSNQRFINIIPDKETSSDYLYYLLLANAKRLNHLSTGTIQANLSRKAFEHLQVQFPPFEEQEQIAIFLDEKCKLIDEMLIKKKKIISELKEYKKSLIYEVVTGKKEV